ncbi:MULTISPECIES: cell wall anchor protein [unclassified Lactococcus]|uniref:cell wall anchor protein n=1 Tax=unclassified Lactococcus TaxID=2643510 RepID=UPI001430346A|nr:MULTISPECIES: cell wall anchor protein [unclassified Lactococcus]KAF6609998.1 cell wall anchor protein [Lactococcus sp. EKM201L]KAF6612721.1 cell wall anchor protein [Lactococcus sp. EKM203L]KAF6643206.1 cell wall anchor protein [Lactococcus sp. EKM501L]KAF6646754.1 cell wall anchor protein [Lactococcus sp. EKM502L]KAF6672438.1 cell wall anchor protein [Lactococcus sp. EKM102L]
MENQKKHSQMRSSSKFWLLSTGILLSLLVTSHPLAVKADENLTVTSPNQTEAVTKPTVNSSLAASDSTTEGNTGSSQAEMQTKAASSITSQASTAPNASSDLSSSTSSAQTSSGEASSNSSEVSASLSSKASTSKAPSVPLDSSKANVTIASSLSASGTIISPALTNGSIASQANGQDPVISTIEATGSVANDITGPATLDGINITIKANNLVSNNFLTPDGLHWSANTQVIPITGQVTGQISTENFGQTDGPTIPATTYTMNAGDSGRITNVGRTLAGTNLDLIYKVISTDESSWQAPKKSTSDCPIGLAFTGEQNIANSDGNSIVALYYGANNVNLNYQIVVHNTNFQVPVLASFITTDIDMAQGVKTNLANLLTVIPKTTNLATDSSGVIYDTTGPDTDLNGQASLPYGGYLGVGFLSNFDYDFYSPAPVRSGDSYQYSQGVRYDLFGSALQAHLTTQVRDIVYLNYYDADENNQLIVPQHQFIWFPNVSWNVPASKFPHYAYGQESQHRNGNTIIVGDYYHIQSTVTYDYYGTDGIYLGQQSITGLYNKPYSVNVPYKFGNYYIEGSTTQSGTYPKHDEILDVYYKYVPPIVYYNTSNPYATTYYANGYEYVPNYIAPVIYYALTYGHYDGGTSYSGGYGYSSGGEDGSTSVASSGGYSLYVPQSAYYSKEAQLVAEENGTYKTSERKTSSVENVDDGYEYIQNGKLYVNWGTVNSKILGGISVSIASVGVASAGMNFNDDDDSPLSPESGEEPEWDGLGDSIGEFGEYEEEREEDDLYEGGGANDPQ